MKKFIQLIETVNRKTHSDFYNFVANTTAVIVGLSIFFFVPHNYTDKPQDHFVVSLFFMLFFRLGTEFVIWFIKKIIKYAKVVDESYREIYNDGKSGGKVKF